MDEEAPLVTEESTPAGEHVTPKKKGKKRGREKDEERGEPVQKRKSASPVDRPSRERKSVERYSALSPRKASTKKVLNIQQGPGEKLKDIPNVSFKLSKRKIDESLQVLHRILFGRNANAHFVKRNILQFSGYVWSQNEDKDRLKVKEKLEKCNKDRLLEFCNLLDIHFPKFATKKDEVSAKLLEFLESPHVTREVVLSENKKGKKRRRVAKGARQGAIDEASSDKGKKRLKKTVDGKAKKAHSKSAHAKREDQVEGVTVDTKEGSAEEDQSKGADQTSAHSNSEAADVVSEPMDPEQTKKMSDVEETDEHEDAEREKKSPVKAVSPTKTKKGVSASATKETYIVVKDKSFTKGSKDKKASSRTRKEKTPSKKYSKKIPDREVSKTKGDSGSDPGSSKQDEKKRKSKSGTGPKDTKESKKHVAKGSKVVKKLVEDKDACDVPSTDQLRDVVKEILKVVDFNVATLADIIRQLGTHFNTDLMHRKTEIKNLLEEVINEMTDDEEDAEDDDGDKGVEEGEKN